MYLGNIPDLKERFGIPVGLSDHSMGSLGAVVGVTLGACVVEKHIKLEGVESADGKFSMTIDEFAQMITDIRNTKLISKGPDYTLSEGEKLSTVFRRSIFAVKPIKAGDLFSFDNIRVIRPGYGLPPKYLKELIGKKSKRNIDFGAFLTKEDLI